MAAHPVQHSLHGHRQQRPGERHATTPATRSTAARTHLPVVGGVKYVAYDVAAWSDLWFYSNPIYVEVAGSTAVAGIK